MTFTYPSDDGWSEALWYNWMLLKMRQGEYPVVLPDVRDEDGNGCAYSRPVDVVLAPLLSPNPAVRVGGILGLTIAAHHVATRERV